MLYICSLKDGTGISLCPTGNETVMYLYNKKSFSNSLVFARMEKYLFMKGEKTRLQDHVPFMNHILALKRFMYVHKVGNQRVYSDATSWSGVSFMFIF